MWKRKATVKTHASKEQIWQLWSDVENWKKWDKGIEESSLIGTFETGQYVDIKPIGKAKLKCKLIEVNETNNFTLMAKLPLTKIYFLHQLEEKEGELLVTHIVEMKGLLTFFFSTLMRKEVTNNLEPILKKIVQKAEEE